MNIPRPATSLCGPASLILVLIATGASPAWSIEGGGIYALDGATVNLTASIGCPPGFFTCNEIIASRLSSGAGRGSAVYLNSASVVLRRQRIEINQESLPSVNVPLFYAQGATGQLVLENLTIASNRANGLIEAESGAQVIAGYLSAADNWYQLGGSGSAISPPIKATGSGTAVEIYSSILWGSGGFDVTAGATLAVDCLITDSTLGVPPGAFAVSHDNPQFLDPASRNLRVAPFSPAIDYCDLGAYPYPEAPDFDGHSRPVDRPDNTNGSPGLAWGTVDIGAFELQLGAIPEPGIFFDGFESGNLSAWSTSVGG